MTEQEFEYKLKDILTEFRIGEELHRLEPDKPYAGLFDTHGKILNLIKQANYVQLAPDQSLPEQPFPLDGVNNACRCMGYATAQDDMLNAGFKKVR